MMTISHWMQFSQSWQHSTLKCSTNCDDCKQFLQKKVHSISFEYIDSTFPFECIPRFTVQMKQKECYKLIATSLKKEKGSFFFFKWEIWKHSI